MNLYGVKAIYKFEMARMKRTVMQSVLSPVISTCLYFVVFGSAIGSRMGDIDNISYGAYIIPGLVMLSLLMQSISNASFGIYMPKFSGTIYEVLSAPVSYVEIVLGYVGAATTKAVILRTELFTQLHILAGLQERDCRVKGLVLSESPETVRTYAAAWLYGASCALSPKPVRHSEALAGMVAGIVSRKTGIRQPEALQAISTLTGSSVLMACYRAGLEGAEFWQANHFVPASSSLYEAVTSNAFI